MRWTVLPLLLAGACSPRHIPADGNGASAPMIDAGPASGDGLDAGGTDCCSATDAGSSTTDAGGPQPPPPPVRAAVQPPDSALQSKQWIETGADGCDGLVPSQVPARLSWNTRDGGCWSPSADGEGNLAAEFGNVVAGQIYALLFLPADGSAGTLATFDRNVTTTARARGFYLGQEQLGSWFGPVTPDGAQEASPIFIESWGVAALVPNPKDGYVEQRDRLAPDSTGALTHYFELRWVAENLAALTDWRPVTSWGAGPPGDSAGATIDAFGSALVLHYFNARLPCPGTHRIDGFWVSEDGMTLPFTPMLPTSSSTASCPPESFGAMPLPLDEGGLALFAPANTGASPTGWFTWYPSGSASRAAAPSWLADHQGSIQRLANGAYLATARDPATCTRTAQIISPSGQVCASVPLEGSNDCALRDNLFPNGTLVLDDPNACSLRWWPGLGSAR